MSKSKKPAIYYIILIEYDMYTYSRRCYTLLSSNGVRGHPDQHGDAVVWRSDRDPLPPGKTAEDIVSEFNDKLRKEKETAAGDLVYYVLNRSGYFVACSSRGPNGPPEQHGDKVVWRGAPGATWNECQAEARRLREESTPKPAKVRRLPRSEIAEWRRVLRIADKAIARMERYDREGWPKSGAGDSR